MLVGVAAGQQVVAGLRLVLEDDSFEVAPEHGIGDRELADLLALREDRQAAAVGVEVLELHRGEGAFAQPVVEEEAQGGAVAEVLGGDDRSAPGRC